MTNMEISAPGIAMAEETKPTEAPKTQRSHRPRTREDFFLFCTYVLEYENYESEKKEETRNTANQSPPLDSSGSSVNSESTHSGQDDKPSGAEDSDESDSFDLITCFCGKPFAGRPMIECSICLTWIHLSCAKIKKNNIPDVFHCAMCKSSNRKHRSASPPLSPPDKGVKRPKRTTCELHITAATRPLSARFLLVLGRWDGIPFPAGLMVCKYVVR